MKLSIRVEEWSTKAPFRISGQSRNAFRTVVVQIGDRHHKGRGEGLPIHYLRETVDGLCSQIDEVASAIESGIAREALLKIPLPRGADEQLETSVSPVPLCADESCQHRGELDEASQRYQVANVKLDRAGGLTEALLLTRAAHEKGLGVYVGNMGGISLATAPALAQLCDYAELNGPLILRHDRLPGLSWRDDEILGFDRALWG